MYEGGRDATPCEASVRRRSTGSPPAPTSGNSAIMGAVRVLGIDVGGTFTDAVFFRDGELRTAYTRPSLTREVENGTTRDDRRGASRVSRRWVLRCSASAGG